MLNLQARVEGEMSREEGTLSRTVNGDGSAMLCRRKRRGVEAPYPLPLLLSRGCDEQVKRQCGPKMMRRWDEQGNTEKGGAPARIEKQGGVQDDVSL